MVPSETSIIDGLTVYHVHSEEEDRALSYLSPPNIKRCCWVCHGSADWGHGRVLDVSRDVALYVCENCWYRTRERGHEFMKHECHFHHDDEGCVGPRFNNAKSCYGGGPRRAGWRWVLVAEYVAGLQELDEKYGMEDWERYTQFLRQLQGHTGVITVDYKGEVI